MNELKSLTLNGKKYSSFPDQTARSRNVTAIEMRDTDPTGEELTEGRIWILRVGDNTLTIPVIELGNVSDNSIAVKLSNASHDENGDVVTTYNVYVNGVLNKTATITAGGTCVVDGLSPETEYQISVRGVKGEVLSEMSNTLTATTLEVPVEPKIVYFLGAVANESDGDISINGNPARSLALYTVGEKACVNSITQETYYPIPVPADATSVTVECSGLMYGYNGWNLNNDTYTFDVDSGWKNSGETYTFAAGAAEYATIGFRKSDYTDLTEEDIAKITITFNTNSEPEIPDEPDEPDEPEAPEYNASGVVILVGTNVGSGGEKGIILNASDEWKIERAISLYTKGVQAVTNQYDENTYYPIPVPADATSVTVVCNGMQYGFDGWNLTNGVYSYDVNSGWQADGATYSFEAGAAEYATIGLKKLDNTAMTEADVANVTITFA